MRCGLVVEQVCRCDLCRVVDAALSFKIARTGDRLSGAGEKLVANDAFEGVGAKRNQYIAAGFTQTLFGHGRANGARGGVEDQ